MDETQPDSLIGTETLRKIRRRILPFVFLLYVVAFLDSANVAYAKLSMSADLGFSEAVYGFGAGVFFAGYLLLTLQSPSGGPARAYDHSFRQD